MPIKIYPEEPVNYTSNLDDFSFNEGLIKSPEFDYGTGYQLSPTTTALTSPSSGASSSSGGGGESGGGGTWRGMKNAYLNQYKDVASQNLGSSNRQNLSYTDSPIFQKGFEAWNPTGLYSLIGQNLTLPMMNLVGLAGGKDYSGIAGIFGDETSAAFANKLINPIFSGTATPEEKQKFANVFGHEMSHLGWDYKDPSERINVPGVGIEGDAAFAKWSGGIDKDYGGEEQWNYMHDLMYGPRSKHVGEDLSKMFTGLPKDSPQREKAYEEAMGILKDFGKSSMSTDFIPGKDYLTDRGLINPGDLSYTPKAHDEIAWSGLTTPSKQAIGFGINPFEDTKAAGQWYAQQTAAKKFKHQQLKNKKQQNFQDIVRRKEEAAKQKAAADAKAKADAAAASKAKWKKDYSNWKSSSGRDHAGTGGIGSAASKKGHSGSSHIGASRFRANGGLMMADGGLINFYRYGGFI